MPGQTALGQALDLIRTPTLARRLRVEPLPEGVLLVLRLAAGDEDAVRVTARTSGRTPEVLRDAAIFYVSQVLFDPAADSYRTLGASAVATREELRAHMVWLLKWLHPDVGHDSAYAIFAGRVLRAWDNLKTPERRRTYDARRNQELTQSNPPRSSQRTRVIARRQVAMGPRSSARRQHASSSKRTSRILWRCCGLILIALSTIAISRSDLSIILEELESLTFERLFPRERSTTPEEVSAQCCDAFAVSWVSPLGRTGCSRGIHAAESKSACAGEHGSRPANAPRLIP